MHCKKKKKILQITFVLNFEYELIGFHIQSGLKNQNSDSTVKPRFYQNFKNPE